MSDDLEDFLKKAARRRRSELPPRVAPATDDAQDIVEADLIHEVSGDDVAAHVAQHLDASGFEKRAARLGEVVGLADEKVESHLHSVFDHDLGRLSDASREAEHTHTEHTEHTEHLEHTEEKREAAAERGLVPRLRSPRNLRDAVILSEILNRPEHRW